MERDEDSDATKARKRPYESERMATYYAANTVGKLAEKIIAHKLQIDSIMLMAMIMEKHSEGEVIGRDAQSALNTLRRDYTAKILQKQGWLGE